METMEWVRTTIVELFWVVDKSQLDTPALFHHHL